MGSEMCIRDSSTCMYYDHSTCMYYDHSTYMYYDHTTCIMSYTAHVPSPLKRGGLGMLCPPREARGFEGLQAPQWLTPYLGNHPLIAGEPVPPSSPIRFLNPTCKNPSSAAWLGNKRKARKLLPKYKFSAILLWEFPTPAHMASKRSRKPKVGHA